MNINTIPCDICGEDYLPHMLNNNSFPSQLTCESCDAEIAADFQYTLLVDCQNASQQDEEEFAQHIAKNFEPFGPDDMR